MSLLNESFLGLPPLTEVDGSFRIPLILNEGVKGSEPRLAAPDLSVLKSFFTLSMEQRLKLLEEGKGLPSYWPEARKITLTGHIKGSARIDGSEDIEIRTAITAGSFEMSTIKGLAAHLLSINEELYLHKERLDKVEALSTAPAAVQSSLPTIKRTLTVEGLMTGSVELDDSSDLKLNLQASLEKSHVGLGKVDNTADADKPLSTAMQAALKDKVSASGKGAKGKWDITAAKATALNTPRNFSMTGVVRAGAIKFDGTGNLQLQSVIDDGALSIDKTKGLQKALDSKLDATAIAGKARQLQQARAFTVTGVVSTEKGVNFDGTGDVNLNLTIKDNALAISNIAGLKEVLTFKANAKDAALTGTPTAPNAELGTANNQIATTQFVAARLSHSAPSKSGAGATGLWEIDIKGKAASAEQASTAGTAEKLANAQAVILTGVIQSAEAKFDGSQPLKLETHIEAGALNIEMVEGLHEALIGMIDRSHVDIAERGGSIALRNAEGALAATQFFSNTEDESDFEGALAYRVNNTFDTAIRFCRNSAAVAGWLGLDAKSEVRFGSVQATRLFAGYDAGIANSMSCSNWFRSAGNTGWYSSEHGGGIYMSDTEYVRVFNHKAMLADDFVIEANGVKISLHEQIVALKAQVETLQKQLADSTPKKPSKRSS